MGRTVKLSRVDGVVRDPSCPVSGEETVEQLDDLENEVYSLMRHETVDEPGQSEGEG